MHPLVKLAKEVIEFHVKEGKRYEEVSHPDMKEYTSKKNACFVTLKHKGKLRGCIGTIVPTRENLVLEVIDNAIKAVTLDPRFLPVSVEELDELTYSVDVLEPLEFVYSKEELDPKRYGVLLEGRGKKGLLLPDIEGIDTVDKQLEIARLKADLGSEEVKIYRFEVTRYH